MELNEQELIRRQKLEELTQKGIDAYPAEMWPVTHTSSEMLSGFATNPDRYFDISFAGRIMSIRDMGKVMGQIKSKAAGRADMGAVGAKVKARLG